MDTTKYNIVNHAGIVIDTAIGRGQAQYLYDYHLFGQRSLRIVPVDEPRVNLVEITKGREGFDVNVKVDGFTENIEGLYDLDSALSYGRMHMTYQTNKYVR